MDALTLLRRARRAGLTVRAVGDKLEVRGPKRLERMALELLRHKAAIMPILADRPLAPARTPPDLRWLTDEEAANLPESLSGLVIKRSGWTPRAWVSYLRQRAANCDAAHQDVAGRYRRAADLLEGRTHG